MKKLILLALFFNFTSSYASLSILTHTAGEAGFLVNSHLIFGEKQAILVDAQFTRSEAKALIEKIKETKKELIQIFITHPHPDHYFGLELIHQAFPNAQIIAAKEVAKEIKRSAQAKLDYWKPIYKDDLTDQLVYPEIYSPKSQSSSVLTLENEKIELIQLEENESEYSTALLVPSAGALITGDLVYNQVHLWLAENHPEEWLAHLFTVNLIIGLHNGTHINNEQIKSIYPGHGNSPAPLDVLLENMEYITTYMQALQQNTKEASEKIVTEKYPNYKLPVILGISLNASLEAKKIQK